MPACPCRSHILSGWSRYVARSSAAARTRGRGPLQCTDPPGAAVRMRRTGGRPGGEASAAGGGATRATATTADRMSSTWRASVQVGECSTAGMDISQRSRDRCGPGFSLQVPQRGGRCEQVRYLSTTAGDGEGGNSGQTRRLSGDGLLEDAQCWTLDVDVWRRIGQG